MEDRFLITAERLESLPPLEVPAGSGAVVSFSGRVRNRNDGREVTGLEYTTFEALALKEGRRIMDEAVIRFHLQAARAAHRVGELGIGEAAVVVEVSASHRSEAFEACRWNIDSIKARVPIWKNEHYREGDRAWVTCHHTPITTDS